MSKSKETPSAPPGDDRKVAASAETAAASPDLEEVVVQFWAKNRTLLIGLAAVILIAIIVRNGLAAYQASQIESIREEYATADSDAALEAFATDRAGTALAGVAQLEIADKAYAEGRYSAALTGYDAAAVELADTVFADRIALGRAMAQMMSGAVGEGESALRALANDTAADPAVRGEAIYHLGGIALANQDTAELDALATQIDAISPGSTWAQRVMLMRSSLEARATAPTGSSAEITFEAP